MEIQNIPSLDWEEWRDIPGYEGKYMVSSFGRVFRLERFVNNHWTNNSRIKSKLLNSLDNGDWYKYVHLHKNGKNKNMRVHRLVASAFLWLDLSVPWDYKKWLCVCHKDDNPLNNDVDNLFLWTINDNNQDAIRKWRRTILIWVNAPMFWRKWLDHPASKPVKQFTKKWEFIRDWESATDAWLKLWISNWNIWTCCKKMVKTAGWYKWEFK